MTDLKTKQLTVSYEKKEVIHQVDLALPVGKITSLIGPNGSGKSTLLKAVARILTPDNGAVLLDGTDIQRLDTRQVTQKLAILGQSSTLLTGLTVGEVVAYGRFPYLKGFAGLKENDYQLIQWALEATGLTELKERRLNALSGGQQQRVWIAMALAQDTDLLLLDEPITFLDPAHQLEILNLLTTIQQQGKTIFMTIHDLNQASRFSDYIIGMRGGEILMTGTPQEVFAPQQMARLFDIDAEFYTPENSQKPRILDYSLLPKGADAS